MSLIKKVSQDENAKQATSNVSDSPQTVKIVDLVQTEDLETGNIVKESIEMLKKELKLVKEELMQLHERNRVKDLGKTFEGSYTRVIVIMCITYIAMFLYMKLVVNDPNPALSAVIPTVGFNLSTWSLGIVKNIWMKYQERRRNSGGTTNDVKDGETNVEGCVNKTSNVVDNVKDIESSGGDCIV